MYTLNHTDGSFLGNIADGVADGINQFGPPMTNLVLFGKNYSGYGLQMNDNWIKVLENSASVTAPSPALVGQLWWDKANDRLSVYDGSVWNVTSGAISSLLQPASPNAGNLWWDTTVQELKIWTSSSWEVIGNVGNIVPNLSGDVTSVGSVTTLATVNANIGTFGSNILVPVITVNEKGLVTNVAVSSISIGSSAIILDGDATAIGTTGSNTTVTLNTVNGDVGTFGNTITVPQITVNSKGLVTGVTDVAISIGSSAIILDGDVTAIGTTGSNTTVTLNTVNGTVGTYGNATYVSQVTVNSKGLVTGVTDVAISVPPSSSFTTDITVNTIAGGITVGTGASNSMYSVAVGKDALMNAVATNNTAVGDEALKATTSGYYNTAIGAGALAQNTTGVYNIAVGAALSSVTTNSKNIAIGYSALPWISSNADQNIAIGWGSGSGMLSGNNNVILGGAIGSSINGLNNHIIIADGAGTERLQIDNAGNANFVGASLTLNGSPIGGGGNINLTGPITSVGNVTSIASQTGTGNVFVMSAYPTLTGVLTVTGNIAATGNISGTRFNNVSITAPATLSTLTIADGKTFTVNNTVTLVGTDATTITLPNVTTAVAGLATTNAFTKPQIGTVTSLSVAANLVAVDLSISNNYTLTLQATTGQTLSNPTGGTTGQSGMITITQNATPSTLAFGANWISTDGTTPTVTTTANAVNLLSYYVVDSSHVWFALSKHGVA